jgi:C-terminal processing protease CtpA/Prc
LPDGGVLEISELDFQMPDGNRLEGIGVPVDENITPTRRDLLRRFDPVLERALELAKG